MDKEIHLRGSSCSHTLGKRVSGGPLAPLETKIELDKGRNSARSYPSIEVVPADSELRKRTVRQGVGYVRTQGYVEALRHIPPSYGGVFLRRRAAKFVAEVPVERNRRENEAETRFIFDLGRDEPSSDAQFATGWAAQTGCRPSLFLTICGDKSRAWDLNLWLSRGRACEG